MSSNCPPPSSRITNRSAPNGVPASWPRPLIGCTAGKAPTHRGPRLPATSCRARIEGDAACASDGHIARQLPAFVHFRPIHCALTATRRLTVPIIALLRRTRDSPDLCCPIGQHRRSILHPLRRDCDTPLVAHLEAL